MGRMGRKRKKPGGRAALAQGARAVTVLYGFYVLFARRITSYLFLRSRLVFFDYEEPLALFLLDYAAALGDFVFAGRCAANILKRMGQKGSRARDKAQNASG